ncbi:hypothetical protein FALBO_13973 [Fusarium albosuccineum]|uniref:Zn(2)-C6 fungal-type domain-containing protein n=1 Tax=Fusarium albosuccineum TaxID=1237068 RepID=A0A8H4L114_9HYPO|nr:hypothetical protein FALBO_13973 [Fusarium albosuccineum]
MPVRRNIPESKRRSRTGCLPCRDEKRPKCGSCEERSVACEYKEFTFVPNVRSSERHERQQIDVGDDTGSSMLIPDEVLPPAKPSPLNPPIVDSPSNSNVLLSASMDTAYGAPPSVISPSQQQLGDGHQIPTPAKWNDTVLCGHSSSNEQTALLRFRYQLAPWLDSNTPRSSFGSEIMTLAREKPVIMDAIIWFAMCRDKHTAIEDARFHEIQEQISLEDSCTKDVGRSLLALGSVFSLRPSQWSTFPFHLPDQDAGLQSLQDKDEPLKTLIQFHLKIGLGVSILTNKPPPIKLPISLNGPFFSPALSAADTYEASLLHLVECLRLIHYELVPLLADSPSTPSPTTESYTLKWAAWSNLWASCVQWFRDRPPGMEPVLESPDLNAGALEAPFPADIYTSAISVQANLIMHLSALLLLSYKPRLIKLSRLQRKLVSRSWHGQKIARLAVWNSFSEQWDPIVIAALLRVAKEMTHTSQQEMLSICFQRITDTTKIPLDEEMTDLRMHWRLSRHGSPPA